MAVGGIGSSGSSPNCGSGIGGSDSGSNGGKSGSTGGKSGSESAGGVGVSSRSDGGSGSDFGGGTTGGSSNASTRGSNSDANTSASVANATTNSAAVGRSASHSVADNISRDAVADKTSRDSDCNKASQNSVVDTTNPNAVADKTSEKALDSKTSSDLDSEITNPNSVVDKTNEKSNNQESLKAETCEIADLDKLAKTAVEEKQLVDTAQMQKAALLDTTEITDKPQAFDYNQIQGVKGNANVTPEFVKGVEAMSERLGAKPEHILAAMSFETGGTFKASIRNSIGATGLIQFLPSTARGLGTTTGKLGKMTAVKQLGYVEKYFQPHKGKLDSLEKVYTAILSGSPKSKPDDVVFRHGTRAYAQNPLDFNRDGIITAREATTPVTARMFGGVGTIQQQLLDENHVRVTDRPGFADRRWGPKTSNAIRDFQKAVGLTPNGSLDEATGRALFNLPNISRSIPKSTVPSNTPLDGAIPKSGLIRGNRSSEVAELQDMLIRFGEMTQAEKSTGPGIFGPRTQASLQEFQRSVGLNSTGKFDSSTQQAMKQILGGVRKGERSELVEQLQNRLVEKGYMTPTQMATGPGVFGTRTDAALRLFQTNNSLGVDGIFGPNSFRALNSGTANVSINATNNSTQTTPNSNFYTANSNVVITNEMAPRLENLARIYQQRTGRQLHITSGYRPPQRQAAAMASLIQRRGANYVRNLYRNKTAVNQIVNAYSRGGVTAMTSVIKDQVARGSYISNHLNSNAVDLSIGANERVLSDIIRQLGGSVLNEGDHYHIRLR